MKYIVVGGETYQIDTQSQIAEAQQVLRDRQIPSTPVWEVPHGTVDDAAAAGWSDQRLNGRLWWTADDAAPEIVPENVGW